MLYVITYDIVDDARRNKVADALKDYGTRVQYSVFEAHLDGELLEELRGRLRRLIEAGEDGVRIYRLCEGCERMIEIVGQGRRDTEEKLYVV